jgi:hypothetical protein
LNRNGAPVFCFDAFSQREPVPTSLENATAGIRIGRIFREGDAGQKLISGTAARQAHLNAVLGGSLSFFGTAFRQN